MQGISAAVVVVGFFIWWYTTEIWFIGTPIMAIGAAGFVVCSFLKVSDSDFEEHLEALIKELNMPKSEEKPYISLKGFITDGAEYAKIRKDGTLCTEKYFKCDIFISNTEIRTELCYADAVQNKAWNEVYRFERDNTEASVEEMRFSCGGVAKAVASMKLRDGKNECTLPVPMNDVGIDKLTEKINERK